MEKSSALMREKKMKLALKLATLTQFNEKECESLLEAHAKIVAQDGPLNFYHFEKVAGPIFDQVLSPETLNLLFRTFDQSDVGHIGAVDWVRGFSTILRGETIQLATTFHEISKNQPKSTIKSEQNEGKNNGKKKKSQAAKDQKEVKNANKSKGGKRKSKGQKVNRFGETIAPPPRVPLPFSLVKEATYFKDFEVGGEMKKASCFPLASGKSKSCGQLNNCDDRRWSRVAVVSAPGGQFEEIACRTKFSHGEFMKLQKAYGVFWNGRVGAGRKLSLLI